MIPSLFSVKEGLTTLGSAGVQILEALDRRFVVWAAGCGAAPVSFLPLLSVERMKRLDYFVNFPHLASTVSRIKPEFAFSGCVAFGLERWLHALLDRYGEPERVLKAIEI